MTAGQLILASVTDEDMVTIFQAKAKSGGKLNFLPVNIQVQPLPGNVQKQVYNNVSIYWSDQEGAKAAAALLLELAK
jgi:cytochrome c oxidase assembly protein Cox11